MPIHEGPFPAPGVPMKFKLDVSCNTFTALQVAKVSWELYKI
jgi:hypothetical protein